jgi:DNA-binding beta-propeller fold protein YncE
MAYVLMVSASQASATTLQVCPSGCTYSQIAPAVAAAQSGDTVTVAAGTYQGGFTINTSLTLAGAGAGATIISGGGPVVTIGSGEGTSKLVVSITGVTITGGVAHSSPQSVALYGKAGVVAAGGGVEVTPDNLKHGSAGTPGATVTIANSVITRNSVAPTTLIPSPSGATCPGGVCKFAAAYGGGIDNTGNLTLTKTTVSDNSSVSPLASDGAGGGIENEMGSLTIVDSTLTGNQTGVMAPNGRFANAGAIDVLKGALTIRGSSLTRNSATATTAEPDSVVSGAIAGAIHVHPSSTATISNTTISSNSVAQTNTGGSANADSGALHTDVNVTLSGDVIADNHVRAVSLGSSSADSDGNSGAGQFLAATVNNTRFTGNTVTVSSAHGPASAEGGSMIFGPGSISNSVIQGNRLSATSPHGNASAIGGGIDYGISPVSLRNTPVSGNTAKATGATGTALGGGIGDVAVPNGPPGGPLTLVNSNVTHNTLSGSANAKLQGGGVFTNFKLTLTNSAFSANTPGECAGKGCAGAAATRVGGNRAAAASAMRFTNTRFGSVLGGLRLPLFGGLRLPHFGFGGFGASAAPAVGVGSGPFAVAVDQATHTAYVVNQYDGQVSVINTATCNALITTSCAGAHPGLITVDTSGNGGVIDAAIDQDTDTLYLVNLFSNTISVVNGATCNASVSTGCGQVPETITVSGTTNDGTDGVAVDDATDTVYVANVNLNTVSVIDGATCNGTTTSGCGQTPATVTVGAAPAVPAVDEATDTIYVPNSGDGTVSVIDGATCNASVTTGCANTPSRLTVGGGPIAAAVDEATDTIYVAMPNYLGSGALAVLNGATCNAAVTSGCGQTPATVPVGSNGDGVLVDPVTQSVFVVNQNDSTLSIIDGAICNALDTAGCAQHPPVVATGYFPGYMDIDIATDTIYVANNGANTVSVINGAACTLTRPLACRHDAPTTTAGPGPGGSAVNEATGTLYVANADGNDVSVIGTARCNAFVVFGCGQSWPTVAAGTFPGGVAVDQKTDTIYVADLAPNNLGENTVALIDGATCNAANSSGCAQHLSPISVGPVPVGVAVDDANDTAYVANVGDGSVSMINTATCNGVEQSGCASTKTLSIGGTNIPDDYVVDEKTDTIYATNSGNGSNTVSVINGATCNATHVTGCNQVAAIKVGSSPSGLAINELTDTVYAINQNDGPSDSDVSVINGATCNVTKLSGCGQSPPTLGLGTAPSQIAVDQATDQVYVSSPFYSDADVYNGATCRGTFTWGCGQTPVTVQLGGNPGNPAVDLARGTVYVPDGSDEEVSYFPAGL